MSAVRQFDWEFGGEQWVCRQSSGGVIWASHCCWRLVYSPNMNGNRKMHSTRCAFAWTVWRPTIVPFSIWAICICQRIRYRISSISKRSTSIPFFRIERHCCICTTWPWVDRSSGVIFCKVVSFDPPSMTHTIRAWCTTSCRRWPTFRPIHSSTPRPFTLHRTARTRHRIGVSSIRHFRASHRAHSDWTISTIRFICKRSRQWTRLKCVIWAPFRPDRCRKITQRTIIRSMNGIASGCPTMSRIDTTRRRRIRWKFDTRTIRMKRSHSMDHAVLMKIPDRSSLRDRTLTAVDRISGWWRQLCRSPIFIPDTLSSGTSNIRSECELSNADDSDRKLIAFHFDFRYTAVAVLEMDYERLDINQCPTGQGNSGPNKFADTARCKKETTECEPIHGWGLRRGGYQCRCRPGYRLPSHIRRPFLGEIVERASAEHYYNGFDCLKIGCE